MTAQANTLNICIGHQAFPLPYWHHIDIMVAPNALAGHPRLTIIPDELYGPHGSSLSEYAQLFWVHEHLASLLDGRTFVRVFHYRRFISAHPPLCGKKSINLPWVTTLGSDELWQFEAEFDRLVTGEIFNTPIRLPSGVMEQYREAHLLEDFLRFGTFLIESNILDRTAVSRFMRTDLLIPSSSIGILHAESFQEIFSVLRQAANFLNTDFFFPREGYQRRNVGFLLERLNSFLIFERMANGKSPKSFGYQMLLSESEIVRHTN